MSPTPSRILLVTGSRALADTDSARAWALEILRARIAATDLVVCGLAEGPDSWALRYTPRRLGFSGTTGRTYRWDVGDGMWVPEVRWTEEPLPLTVSSREWWRERFLARNRAMVAWCAAQRDAGADVSVLALVAPWSRTGGTRYTVALARDAGLAVVEFVCPAELGLGDDRG